MLEYINCIVEPDSVPPLTRGSIMTNTTKLIFSSGVSANYKNLGFLTLTDIILKFGPTTTSIRKLFEHLCRKLDEIVMLRGIILIDLLLIGSELKSVAPVALKSEVLLDIRFIRVSID